ncbi:hypothetical protein [Leucobacter chinensis]|uniref:hypothetical protein n=1 Tax=Leucobacter chinensis TaxID=2851010 RepID=UPI001C2164B1|nr:hypothetical protein [Leucobacter chinensis]
MTHNDPDEQGGIALPDAEANPGLPQPGTPRQEPKKKARRGWSTTNKVLGAVIAVVGAITGTITAVEIVTRDSTNFSHLEMSFEPVTDETSEWAVTAAQLSEHAFPAGARCTGDQLDWLEANAIALNRHYMLSLRNTASSGAMLAINDIRSTAPEAPERGELFMRVVCDPTGFPARDLFYGKLVADRPDLVATNVNVKGDAAAQRNPEVPVSFNLGPGESGKIPLDLFGKYPANGEVELTVYSVDEQRVERVAGSDFTMPALLFGGDWFLVTTDSGVECRRIEAGAIETCTLDEALHEIEIARP